MVETNQRRVVRNRLLAALPAAELDELLSKAELVKLEIRDLLFDPDKPIEFVYFFEHGVGSVLGVMSDGTSIETATIGNEGFVGLAVFHGVDTTPAQSFCQVSGEAYKIASSDFRAFLESHPGELRKVLDRYTEALFTLVAQSSACNRMHNVRQRCARWLLITHDRVGNDEFDLTQSFLAQMLGVRRASVNQIARGFQQAGAIRYTMGKMKILDRRLIEDVVCECYLIIKREFDRLLGGVAGPSPLDDVNLSENGESTAEPPRVDPKTDA